MLFLLLLLMDIVALVGLLATPLVLFVSLFVADDPHANPFLVLALMLIFWSFPVTVGFGSILGLRAARRRDIKAMARWTALAYSSPLAIFLVATFGN